MATPLATLLTTLLTSADDMSGLPPHHPNQPTVQANFFLQWYYGCYPLFGYCCLAQEFYYLAKVRTLPCREQYPELKQEVFN